MVKTNTITIELKDNVTTKEADNIMKMMLKALSPNQIDKIEDAHLSSLIMSIERGENPDELDKEFGSMR